jgi:hypothetical protein
LIWQYVDYFESFFFFFARRAHNFDQSTHFLGQILVPYLNLHTNKKNVKRNYDGRHGSCASLGGG